MHTSGRNRPFALTDRVETRFCAAAQSTAFRAHTASFFYRDCQPTTTLSMLSADFVIGMATVAVATLAYVVFKALTLPKRRRKTIPVEGNPDVGLSRARLLRLHVILCLLAC